MRLPYLELAEFDSFADVLFLYSMVSPLQLQQICTEYNLAPVFFTQSSTNDVVVSLDGTYPGHGLATHLPERLKLWSEAPDYLDPQHPWRPYIPNVINKAPPHFHWINW